MNKIIVFIALLLIGCGVFFLYFNHDDENAGVVETVGIQRPDEKNVPVLNTAPATSGDAAEPVSPTYVKPSVSPVEENDRPPLVTEPERIESKLESKMEPESEPVDDGVPDSYPIEEAELYFVPKEDRYPGNIGGPPPLNLPDPEFEPSGEGGVSRPVLPGSR